MTPVPDRSTFESAYAGQAPWDIGKPQKPFINGRVIVDLWGQQGQCDLRPFFKTLSLTGKGVRVRLIERTREHSKIQTGDDFLYGERLTPKWPWRAYWRKWQQRALQEPEDWTAAPLANAREHLDPAVVGFALPTHQELSHCGTPLLG